jgi:hypothetical protein
VDRGHPQWLDLFFFVGKVVEEGGGRRRLFAEGEQWAAVSGSV